MRDFKVYTSNIDVFDLIEIAVVPLKGQDIYFRLELVGIADTNRNVLPVPNPFSGRDITDFATLDVVRQWRDDLAKYFQITEITDDDSIDILYMLTEKDILEVITERFPQWKESTVKGLCDKLIEKATKTF